MFKKRVRLLLQNFVLEVLFFIANQSPYEMYQHEYAFFALKNILWKN